MTKINEVIYEGKSFNFVSLFSGIGGFEQALNKLGGKCVLASEIDKFAEQSYQALYGHPTAGDIMAIEAEDVPNHDLITAGFPCVAFSVAGKRAGMIHVCDECRTEQNITFNEYINNPKCDECLGSLTAKDVRGLLFFEIARIALSKQPRVLLLENVKGLVNHDKGRTLNVMIETLCEIGYTVDFTLLNSKYFGVPQNRERIFIIAVRDDLITPEPWVIEGKTIVPRGKGRIQALEGVKTFNFDFPEEGDVTVRLRDILEAHVDEKYYLGEDRTAALVAQLEERGLDEPTVFDVSQMGHEGKPRMYQDVAPTITARDYKEPRMVGHIDLKGQDAIKRVYSAEGVAPTLTTMGGGHREPKIAEPQVIATGGDLSYCLDANYTKGIAPNGIDKGRRTHIGEEVRPVLTPDRVEKRQNGRRFKEDGEESFTLTAQDKHGVAIGQAPKYRIRKLTPLECWRLQGFSDEAHQTVVDAGLSDSQRYKQAGNAVTVNVISVIGERLTPYLRAT